MMVDAGDGAVVRLRWMDGAGGGEWWRVVEVLGGAPPRWPGRGGGRRWKKEAGERRDRKSVV